MQLLVLVVPKSPSPARMVIVPKSGFIYQLGSEDVKRIVDQHCSVLKQSVETTSLVCEIEAVEGPTIWKKLRGALGKCEGDESSNKLAIKEMLRPMICDLDLKAPLDIWLRSAADCSRARDRRC